jgi:4-amino-4-deoxy-L-arabinose transferase-like glycosyltransferase
MQAFRGQRPTTMVLLAAIVALFGAVSAWNIGLAGFSEFYSSAAHSMSVSWRAFFFGSFDPGASITLDKLSGFLVPQAVSARIFGFSAWSIALPQVTEGMVTIVAAYVLGSRWKGAAAGILAAFAAATTPILASMFGHIMEDGLLTMSLALALLCWQTFALNSTATTRMAPLIFSALWVAVGFQAKMMQAWLILPALVVGILLVSRLSLGGRIRAALVFLVVAFVGSVLWMSIVQSIPAGSRPYFDGSTNDNVFSMVFGYNGFNRLIPNFIPGAAPDFISHVFGHGVPGASRAKLVLPAYATQVGWLYPLALAGIVFTAVAIVSVVVRRLRQRGHELDSGIAMDVVVTVWLAASVVLLSLATIPHTAYVAAISVQVALLAASGIVQLGMLWRSGHLRGRLIAAIAVVAQTAWVVVLLGETKVAPSWLPWTVASTGIVAAVGMLFTVLSRTRRPLGPRLVAAAALLAVFLAPVVWTGSVLDVHLGGTANDAYAGPHISSSPRFFRPQGTAAEVSTFTKFEISAPVLSNSNPRLTPAQRSLVDYTSKRVTRGAVLFLTSSWNTSAPYLIDAGFNVPAIGGFSESVPSPTLAGVESMVRAGTLRFVLLPIPNESRRVFALRKGIEPWVRSTCTAIPKRVLPLVAQHTLWDCGSR